MAGEYTAYCVVSDLIRYRGPRPRQDLHYPPGRPALEGERDVYMSRALAAGTRVGAGLLAGSAATGIAFAALSAAVVAPLPMTTAWLAGTLTGMGAALYPGNGRAPAAPAPSLPPRPATARDCAVLAACDAVGTLGAAVGIVVAVGCGQSLLAHLGTRVVAAAAAIGGAGLGTGAIQLAAAIACGAALATGLVACFVLSVAIMYGTAYAADAAGRRAIGGYVVGGVPFGQ